MKNLTKVSVLSLGLFLSGALLSQRIASAETVQDSKEATKLLTQIKQEARQLKQDAETLQTYTRTDSSRASHACADAIMRQDITVLGRDLNKLEQAVVNGPAWQKEAAEQIHIVTQELANNHAAVIQGLNAGDCLVGGTYADYVKTNVVLSDRLLSIVKQSLDESKAVK